MTDLPLHLPTAEAARRVNAAIVATWPAAHTYWPSDDPANHYAFVSEPFTRLVFVDTQLDLTSNAFAGALRSATIEALRVEGERRARTAWPDDAAIKAAYASLAAGVPHDIEGLLAFDPSAGWPG